MPAPELAPASVVGDPQPRGPERVGDVLARLAPRIEAVDARSAVRAGMAGRTMEQPVKEARELA